MKPRSPSTAPRLPERRAARAASARRRAAPARDQAESPFVPILRELLTRVPGAVAAALVDFEGETVDYAGALDPFDVKIAAAHFRVVLDDLDGCRTLGRPRVLIVRASRRSYVVRTLPDGYALVVVLGRRAGFTASARAFGACERALCREASWPIPSAASGPLHAAGHDAHWFPVTVACDARRRPTEVSGHFGDGTKKRAQAVDVLGALVALGPRERGFRVRLDSGVEMNLVREAGGYWYADEEL